MLNTILVEEMNKLSFISSQIRTKATEMNEASLYRASSCAARFWMGAEKSQCRMRSEFCLQGAFKLKSNSPQHSFEIKGNLCSLNENVCVLYYLIRSRAPVPAQLSLKACPFKLFIQTKRTSVIRNTLGKNEIIKRIRDRIPLDKTK